MWNFVANWKFRSDEQSFYKHAQEIRKSIPENTSSPKIPIVEKAMFLYEITENNVHKIIEDLDNKSSSDDDYISNLIVKSSKQTIVPYLTHLNNL